MFVSKRYYEFCLTQFLIKHIFYVSIPKNTCKIQKFHFLDKICEIQKKRLYGKLSAKRERYDENVFLKADRALSKLNLLFHLNSKRNRVTLRKCVIHIIFNIIIKLVWASVSNRSATIEYYGAQSVTIESRSLGALKLASCARSARWECAREAGRFFYLRTWTSRGWNCSPKIV